MDCAQHCRWPAWHWRRRRRVLSQFAGGSGSNIGLRIGGTVSGELESLGKELWAELLETEPQALEMGLFEVPRHHTGAPHPGLILQRTCHSGHVTHSARVFSAPGRRLRPRLTAHSLPRVCHTQASMLSSHNWGHSHDPRTKGLKYLFKEKYTYMYLISSLSIYPSSIYHLSSIFLSIIYLSSLSNLIYLYSYSMCPYLQVQMETYLLFKGCMW